MGLVRVWEREGMGTLLVLQLRWVEDGILLLQLLLLLPHLAARGGLAGEVGMEVREGQGCTVGVEAEEGGRWVAAAPAAAVAAPFGGT